MFSIFQEVISTPYIVFTKVKACEWLVTRIREEITSKNYIRKDLKWSRQKQRKIRTTHGLCEFGRCCANFAQAEGVVRISHKPGAVVFWRPYLPHFNSKLYTVWSIGFFTSWYLKWYIACRKWTSGSAPKVRRKTAAAVLYFLHFLFASLCFSPLLGLS